MHWQFWRDNNANSDILVKRGYPFWAMSQSILLYILPTEVALRWRHNGPDGVSNHQPRHCLVNRLFRRRSKKTSKRRATRLCVGNSPVTGEFSAQMASSAKNVSIWWRHHGPLIICISCYRCMAWLVKSGIAWNGWDINVILQETSGNDLDFQYHWLHASSE